MADFVTVPFGSSSAVPAPTANRVAPPAVRNDLPRSAMSQDGLSAGFQGRLADLRGRQGNEGIRGACHPDAPRGASPWDFAPVGRPGRSFDGPGSVGSRPGFDPGQGRMPGFNPGQGFDPGFDGDDDLDGPGMDIDPGFGIDDGPGMDVDPGFNMDPGFGRPAFGGRDIDPGFNVDPGINRLPNWRNADPGIHRMPKGPWGEVDPGIHPMQQAPSFQRGFDPTRVRPTSQDVGPDAALVSAKRFSANG